MPVAPPVPLGTLFTVVPPVLATPPVPWVPPLPEERELFDEHAPPRIASSASIEWSERVDLMKASLLADGRCAVSNPDTMDSSVHARNAHTIRVLGAFRQESGGDFPRAFIDSIPRFLGLAGWFVAGLR